jgi:DNA-directed RNA polymerase subunit RPC12/RpoP
MLIQIRCLLCKSEVGLTEKVQRRRCQCSRHRVPLRPRVTREVGVDHRDQHRLARSSGPQDEGDVEVASRGWVSTHGGVDLLTIRNSLVRILASKVQTRLPEEDDRPICCHARLSVPSCLYVRLREASRRIGFLVIFIRDTGHPG